MENQDVILHKFKEGSIQRLICLYKDGIDTDICLDKIDDDLFEMYCNGVPRDILQNCRDDIYAGYREHIEMYGILHIFERMHDIPRIKEKLGFVYALLSTDGLVKIGRALNPKARIRGISTHTGRTFVQAYISPPVDDYKKLERTLHQTFAGCRKMGEWFDISIDTVVSEIKTLIPQAQLSLK